MNEAWEIVETTGKTSLNFHLAYGSDPRDPLKIGWDCVIGNYCAEADTAPMAICLAFLKLGDATVPPKAQEGPKDSI